MNLLVLFAVLCLGFIVYFFLKDKIFEPSYEHPEKFETPAPGPIEIRQSPHYPSRVVAPSGSNPPSQASDQVVQFGEPQPKDPYHEAHEDSEIPERMRNPENSFRPAPLQDQHDIAVQSGVASRYNQASSDNAQQFSQEFIQGGGEFMPGIFANDTFNDASFSAF
jgi:hypothetical protein